MKLTEDTLVQRTTAEYLDKSLKWDSVYAYNQEDFGPNSLLGRNNDHEVVLRRDLLAALVKFNPGLPSTAYDEAIRQLTETSASQTLLTANEEKYDLLRDGVQVTYRNENNDLVKQRLRVFDFVDATANRFLCVRELWVRGDIYRRRADIVGFVNGIPLLFMECKNIHKDLRRAYEDNLADYRDTIPHLFHHNALIVLGNGDKAKLGSVTSQYEHFHEWKRLAEEEPGVVDMETLLKGVCNNATFLDLFEHFIVFDKSAGPTVKILAKNHQYLGVNRAIQSLCDRKARKGKLGVFWHTQGSGKSYSMVFFTRKVHRSVGGNYTFVVCTDRDDLDSQIYKTFAGCGVVDNDRDPCRASSGESLRTLLSQHKSHIFTLIQKFNQNVDPTVGWSQRDDIVVITDEAHRTQYGTLSLNMRNAIPNASYIGFTGTPLFKDDQITRRVFGDYISTYDFQRAVEDGATVPLYYDARGDKLGIATSELNEKIAEAIERAEIDDVDVAQRLESEIKRDYHVITAQKRLEQVARDFVRHYSTEWESGKAMIVCIDKVTCVRMYQLILPLWAERIRELDAERRGVTDEQDVQFRERQLAWMRETLAAVVVSEEQGEVDRFRKWDLDIRPHRKLIKDGFELPDGTRIDVESAFKRDEHPFRIAVVCAMWLTGFDVPSLSTLYLDKPLKAHTLMQAIARANRVFEGKNNGLIVDYCGILKNLRKALATFAGQTDTGHGGAGGELDPTRPEEELLEELQDAVDLVRSFLAERGASLDAIISESGFGRNAAIVRAKEAANENDEMRKRFEVMCREVFKRFRACITMDGVNAFRHEYDAVNIVYKSLQQDAEHADITDIIRQLHGIVEQAITTATPSGPPSVRYDISKIDFERLRQEFTASPAKNTTAQNLRQAIEKRLQRLLAQNPLRTNFQSHYEDIVHEYNQEKDRVTIEHTFEQLLRFVQELDEEATRAVREGLDVESVAIFDLLKKPALMPKDIARIKQVAVGLLATLKAEKLRVDQWRDKEATRDAVRSTIFDFLYSDNTGLPDAYADEEIKTKSEDVFRHVFYAYPTLPSPLYGAEK
ncbi:MAG: box helicase [Bryobacterales bacterium]|nr:box helicase [Bryobacterales bacterium]